MVPAPSAAPPEREDAFALDDELEMASSLGASAGDLTGVSRHRQAFLEDQGLDDTQPKRGHGFQPRQTLKLPEPPVFEAGSGPANEVKERLELNKWAHNIFQEVRQIEQDRDQLRVERDELEREIRKIERDRDQLQASLGSLAPHLDQTQQDLEQTQREFKALKLKCATLEHDLELAQSVPRDEQKTQLQHELRLVKEQLAESKQGRDAAVHETNTLREQLKAEKCMRQEEQEELKASREALKFAKQGHAEVKFTVKELDCDVLNKDKALLKGFKFAVAQGILRSLIRSCHGGPVAPENFHFTESHIVVEPPTPKDGDGKIKAALLPLGFNSTGPQLFQLLENTKDMARQISESLDQFRHQRDQAKILKGPGCAIIDVTVSLERNAGRADLEKERDDHKTEAEDLRKQVEDHKEKEKKHKEDMEDKDKQHKEALQGLATDNEKHQKRHEEHERKISVRDNANRKLMKEKEDLCMLTSKLLCMCNQLHKEYVEATKDKTWFLEDTKHIIKHVADDVNIGLESCKKQEGQVKSLLQKIDECKHNKQTGKMTEEEVKNYHEEMSKQLEKLKTDHDELKEKCESYKTKEEKRYNRSQEMNLHRHMPPWKMLLYPPQKTVYKVTGLNSRANKTPKLTKRSLEVYLAGQTSIEAYRRVMEVKPEQLVTNFDKDKLIWSKGVKAAKGKDKQEKSACYFKDVVCIGYGWNSNVPYIFNKQSYPQEMLKEFKPSTKADEPDIALCCLSIFTPQRSYDFVFPNQDDCMTYTMAVSQRATQTRGVLVPGALLTKYSFLLARAWAKVMSSARKKGMTLRKYLRVELPKIVRQVRAQQAWTSKKIEPEKAKPPVLPRQPTLTGGSVPPTESHQSRPSMQGHNFVTKRPSSASPR